MKMKVIDVADWLCNQNKQQEATHILGLESEFIEKQFVRELFSKWFQDETFKLMETQVNTYIFLQSKMNENKSHK